MALGLMLSGVRSTASSVGFAPRLMLRAAGMRCASATTGGGVAGGVGFLNQETSTDLWSSLLAPHGISAVSLREPKPDLLERFSAIDNMARCEKMKVELAAIRDSFQRHELDSGSCQVQVASLTRKISAMTDHLQDHHKDNHSRRGLMGMLQKRAKLLKYMRKNEPDNYQMVLYRLGLKDRTFVEARKN
jgi:small subunit ribosomal protein S15